VADRRTDFVVSHQKLQICYWLKLVRFKDCGLREGVRDEAFDSCGGVSPGLPRGEKVSHRAVAPECCHGIWSQRASRCNQQQTWNSVTRELTSSNCVGMMGDIMELLLPAKLHVQKLFWWVAETGLARFILPRRELHLWKAGRTSSRPGKWRGSLPIVCMLSFSETREKLEFARACVPDDWLNRKTHPQGFKLPYEHSWTSEGWREGPFSARWVSHGGDVHGLDSNDK